MSGTIETNQIDSSTGLPTSQKSTGNAAWVLGTSLSYKSSVSFTRPSDTTAYAALDVVSNSTSSPTVMTFSSAGSTAGTVLITAASLEIDIAAVPSGMGIFRLHLYSSSPTAINDNAAFDLPSGDRAKYLGYIDIGTPVDLGATLWTQNVDILFQAKLDTGSTSLYGILQTLSAYTPSSADVFKVTLSAVQVS